MAYVSIFTDNDLTHITEDHFEIKLIPRLLYQYMLYNHPCSHQGMMMQCHRIMYIHNHIRVQMVQDHQHLSSQNICIHYLPIHRHRVWLYGKNLVHIRFKIAMI